MDTVSKEEYEQLQNRFEYLLEKEDLTAEEIKELEDIFNAGYIYEIEHAGE